MTARIRSGFKRKILIILIAVMITGIISPAPFSLSNNAVRGLVGHQNVLNSPDLAFMSDFIADSSAKVDLTRFLTERNTPGRQIFTSSNYIGRADFKDCNILSLNTFIFLLFVLFGTSIFSFKHIFYIHLKDGNK